MFYFVTYADFIKFPAVADYTRFGGHVAEDFRQLCRVVSGEEVL